MAATPGFNWHEIASVVSISTNVKKERIAARTNALTQKGRTSVVALSDTS